MDVKDFSGRYRVRELTEMDIPDIYELCWHNPLYYQYCPPFVSEDKIRLDMQALPPRKTLEDKYYLGYFDGERLIAVMDFIHSFPDEKTDFLGFFMVEHSLQGRGTGSEIIEELCAFEKARGRACLRLGWIQDNPQAEHFWKKNGFRETGVLSATDDYTIVVAQKRLDV